jgi:histidinol-phosphatase
MSPEPRDTLLRFALELARAAEAEILPRYRSALVSRKSDGSDVTDADREAELVMRRLIEKRYPEDGILGEEHGAVRPQAARQWILDPVDGTASFALGLPVFGTLVGVVEDGEPVAGVVHMPAMGETLYAATGQGCWWIVGNAPPVRVGVAPAVPLEQAYVSIPGRLQAGTLAARAGRVRFGGDCVQHALVCRGRLHAAVDPVMKPWDSAALVPCVLEAGGTASTLAGATRGVVEGGSLVTACSEALKDALIQALR